MSAGRNKKGTALREPVCIIITKKKENALSLTTSAKPALPGSRKITKVGRGKKSIRGKIKGVFLGRGAFGAGGEESRHSFLKYNSRKGKKKGSQQLLTKRKKREKDAQREVPTNAITRHQKKDGFKRRKETRVGRNRVRGKKIQFYPQKEPKVGEKGVS